MTRRVLIADDNEHNREYARQVLTDCWAVSTAADGLEALALVTRERPDLVLLDLSMPGLNGWEVARRLKADPATAAIPLVACTAHAMSGDRERALATGFDGYLAKPYRPHDLIACVESFLGPAAPADGPGDEWNVDESRLHDSREGEP
ncbi:MAG: response regulator [Planctomycetes bacterium]|nr:response regulator [Planctomycetota bacterium]